MAVFCFHVGMERNGSTYRKLIQIAENADRLVPHVLNLPPAWTTLYDLAKLPHQDFDKLVESGIICPSMTAKDVQAVVPPEKPKGKKKAAAEKEWLEELKKKPGYKEVASPPPPKGTPIVGTTAKPDFTIVLDLADSVEGVRRKIHASMKELSGTFSVPMTVGEDLAEAISKPVKVDDDEVTDYFEQLARR